MKDKTYNINRRKFFKRAFTCLILPNLIFHEFNLMNLLIPYRIELLGNDRYGKINLFRLM